MSTTDGYKGIMKSPSISIPPRLAGHILKGHPWLYADTLPRGLPAMPSGTFVDLTDMRGKPLGQALYDADSPIALRVVATHRDLPPGPALWRARIRTARQLRERLLDRSQTNTYRLIHGEGDRLPGVVADTYAGYLVMKLDTPAWLPHLPDLISALEQEVGPTGIYFKGLVGRTQENEAPRVLSGDPPPEDLDVLEYGLRYRVNVYQGQKTGLFLDQRENRRLVRSFANGLSVLNLHAYTGGFSLAAAAGGATRVTSVDISRPVMAAARDNFAINGFDPEDHEFVTQDAIAFLKACAQERRQFGAVIVDPPSLAMRQQALQKGSRAYITLNERAIRQVVPGGFLATSSCSSHVTMERFTQILREAAAAARRTLRVLAVRHEPVDHPVPLHFPQGHYLKFVLALVEAPEQAWA